MFRNILVLNGKTVDKSSHNTEQNDTDVQNAVTLLSCCHLTIR